MNINTNTIMRTSRQKHALAMCALVALTASAQFSSVSEVVGLNRFVTKKTLKAPTSADISDLPTKVRVYAWDKAENEWIDSRTVTLEYYTNPKENGYGKVRCRNNVGLENSDVRTYDYNADGQVSRETWKYYTDNGRTLLRNQMYIRLYDAVVKNFVCSKETCEWDNATSSWKRTNWEKYTVERDAAGNVVKVTPSSLKDGVLKDGKPLVITYTNGKASLVNDTQEGMQISDIKWAETNGQIVTTNPMEWILSGNKPLSFTMFDGENAANYTMEYFTDHVKVTMSQGPMTNVIEYYGFDFGNDSQIQLINTYLNSGGTNKLVMSGYDETVTNAIDNEVKAIQYSLSDEGYDVDRWIDYEETLRGKNPATHIIKKFEAEESATPSAVEVKPLPFSPTKPPVAGLWSYDKKYEYSGYLGESGIENVTNADDESVSAPAVYYNLQGQKVATPRQHGVYIEKRGSKARKVVF